MLMLNVRCKDEMQVFLYFFCNICEGSRYASPTPPPPPTPEKIKNSAVAYLQATSINDKYLVITSVITRMAS